MTDVSCKRKRNSISNEVEKMLPEAIPDDLCSSFCLRCNTRVDGIQNSHQDCPSDDLPHNPAPSMVRGHVVRFFRLNQVRCWHQWTHIHTAQYECDLLCHEETSDSHTCNCPCFVCLSHDQPIHAIDLKVTYGGKHIQMLIICECDIEGASCICTCEECEERKNHPGIKPCIRK